MTKFIQLKNRFSNNILTDSQLKNTKGRGRGISRDVVLDFVPAPVTSSPASTPPTSFPTNNPKQGQNPKGISGPPQFGPGGPMGPVI